MKIRRIAPDNVRIRRLSGGIGLGLIAAAALAGAPSALFADGAERAAGEVEKALHLKPDTNRGREVYKLCAVCHMPEGWGRHDGSYPQIAGQHDSVIIKQLADIRARNRDTPTMLPFTMLEHLELQQIADVAAYLSRLPMSPDNGVGPGTDLAQGKRLYREFCVDCHGEQGQGNGEKGMPIIQGQHYQYLVRQFEWIRDGRRRNGDEEMIKQIRGFSDRDIAAIMDYTSRLKPPAERLAVPGWNNPDYPEFSGRAPMAPVANME